MELNVHRLSLRDAVDEILYKCDNINPYFSPPFDFFSLNLL